MPALKLIMMITLSYVPFVVLRKYMQRHLRVSFLSIPTNTAAFSPRRWCHFKSGAIVDNPPCLVLGIGWGRAGCGSTEPPKRSVTVVIVGL